RKRARSGSGADGKRTKRRLAGLVGRSHAGGRGREPARRARPPAPGQEAAETLRAPIANGENGPLASANRVKHVSAKAPAGWHAFAASLREAIHRRHRGPRKHGTLLHAFATP